MRPGAAQAPSAGTTSQNGPQSPFEDVKLEGPDETWWGANEQLHLQRMQEQEKQRAAQLQHTRAWAEAQVKPHPLTSTMDAFCQTLQVAGRGLGTDSKIQDA